MLCAALAVALSGCQLDVVLRRLPREKPIVVSIDEQNPGRVPVAPEVLMEGARIFDERCSPCHGERGNGDGPLASVLPIRPRNYHSEEFRWGTRPSDIAATIRLGRSGVMPPFATELTPREIWATAYVVWSWIPEDRRMADSQTDLEAH